MATFCPLIKMEMLQPDLWGFTRAFIEILEKHTLLIPYFVGASCRRLTPSPWRKGYVTPDQRQCWCSTSQPRGDGEPSCFASIIPSGPHL